MTPERLRQIEELYHSAREREPSERAAFLAQACRGDEELRQELDQLLAPDSSSANIFDSPAADLLTGSTVAQLTTGTQIGPYKVEAALGAGGMGEVYRAVDTRLKRTVAIKVAKENFGERFLREARAASALNHPNIVTLYDIASESGIDYLVMEYVPGQSLDKWIASGGLPLAEVLAYATQIASALVAAHAAAIIHRDIKPSNVIVTPESQVKVLDFGLAKLEEPAVGPESQTRAGEQSLTETGVVMGTVAYMSPEQARAEEVDARTDLFSFGTVLYEMATGRRAFPKALDWTTPPMEALGPELGRIVLKLLEPDRELRYQTAADVAADLKRLQRGAERQPTLRTWRVAVAALLTLVIAAAAVLYLRRPSPPGRDQWVQLTNFPDSVSQPALSPDGRMLAFFRGPGTFYTSGQIYVKILPDGESKQLTNDRMMKMSPVFSPDGSHIAYTTVGDGFNWDTWRVPVLGGEPRPWLPNASGLVWIDKENMLFSVIKEGKHMAVATAKESRADERDVYIPPRDGMGHRSYISPDRQWVLVVEMEERGYWLPCRLIAFDGSTSSRPVGPPGAGCTFAAWSPDGAWMYFTTDAGGAYHTWRQKFPNGRPEQITSGPTLEEGIAMAADGRSFVTSVGVRQRPVTLHDVSGDRQISLEGYAYSPLFTRDAKSLTYKVLKGASPYNDSSELWIVDLDSGRREPLLPGFPIAGDQERNYDISPDGRQIVIAVRDREGKPHLWLAPLDRRAPPIRIPNVEGSQPVFGPTGEIFFRGMEGSTVFAYRVRPDGAELRKAISQPVLGPIRGISPDGEWMVAAPAVPDQASYPTMAYSLRGGTPILVSRRNVRPRWSSDSRLLYLSHSTTGNSSYGNGTTYAFPLPPGRMFPDFPPGGLPEEEMARWPGVRVIEAADFAPGPSPDVYAFSRETTQRNLYRIPIP